MWTEQAISASLDGTFTKLTDAGHLVTRKVKKDFIPSYDPPKEQKQATSTKGVKRGPYKGSWGPDDDTALIELRRQRVTREDCARLMRRCRKAVARRINELQLTGRI
jgi:hypothetical protein